MSNSSLDVRNLTKVYGDRPVVDDVTLTVGPAEIFGLLGPNGSGKTTTIRMALDIIRPDSGTVSLLSGMPTRDALARVGYLPGERGLYQRSRVLDILTYLSKLKRLDSATASRRARHMLERVGLGDHAGDKVQALSRGMAQLGQFAGALLHEPDLIILDEPFSGLDPLNVQLMKEIIREHQSRGAATVFSTHQMRDVEELCERVLLLTDGRTLLYGDPAEAKRARGTRNVRIEADRRPDSVPGAELADGRNGLFEYKVSGETAPEEVFRAFAGRGHPR